MSLPTLRQLQYLTALVDLKHFGHAAAQCFVTQSTLSAAIQDLEASLGISLLERSNRKVLPTELGRKIAEQAQHILSLSADLVDTAQSERNPLSGRIRIGIIPSISPFILPKALGSIRQQLTELELILIEDQSDRLLTQLRTGQIDIALLAFPFNAMAEFKYHIFAKEQFWLALPQHHALTQQKMITTDQLPSDELLLLSEGHCLREHVLSACNLASTKHCSSVQGTSLYTLIEMVAGGLGLTLIPEMALHSDIVKRNDICLRPLIHKNNTSMREIGLVWRHSYTREATIEILSQHFSNALINKTNKEK